MAKTSNIFADTLPSHFRRACSCMSGDGGFKDWLDGKFGAGKWMHGDCVRGDFEIAITSRELGDLAVEYGYARLISVFGSLDPVTAAQTDFPRG